MSRYYSVLVITVVVINGLHCIYPFRDLITCRRKSQRMSLNNISLVIYIYIYYVFVVIVFEVEPFEFRK